MALDQILREHCFTNGLAGSGLAKLASLACEESFETDQIILVSGQQSKDFYLLLSGSVCVEVCAPHYTVCVQALEPGEAFGWSSLLLHHDTLFQIRARERSTVLRLDGARLSAVCGEDPEFGLELFRRLLDLVAGRVKATELRLAEFCGIATTGTPGAHGEPRPVT
jgi:CRP-like cAMP-binding protein